ncbi:hypothetical protein Tco_0935186 [Tanacetum coccineum]
MQINARSFLLPQLVYAPGQTIVVIMRRKETIRYSGVSLRKQKLTGPTSLMGNRQLVGISLRQGTSADYERISHLQAGRKGLSVSSHVLKMKGYRSTNSSPPKQDNQQRMPLPTNVCEVGPIERRNFFVYLAEFRVDEKEEAISGKLAL